MEIIGQSDKHARISQMKYRYLSLIFVFLLINPSLNFYFINLDNPNLSNLSVSAANQFIKNQTSDGSFPEFNDNRMWKWTMGDELIFANAIRQNPNNWTNRFIDWLVNMSNVLTYGIPKAKSDSGNIVEPKKVYNFEDSYINVGNNQIELGNFTIIHVTLSDYVINSSGLFSSLGIVRLLGLGKYKVCNFNTTVSFEITPLKIYHFSDWSVLSDGFTRIVLINKTLTTSSFVSKGETYYLEAGSGFYSFNKDSINEEISNLLNEKYLNYYTISNLDNSHSFSVLPELYDWLKYESIKTLFYKYADMMYNRFSDHLNYRKEAFDTSMVAYGLAEGSIIFGNSTLMDMARTVIQNVLSLQDPSGGIIYDAVDGWVRHDWIGICVPALKITGHGYNANQCSRYLQTYLQTTDLSSVPDYEIGNLVYGLSFYNPSEANRQSSILINRLDSNGLTTVVNGETLACTWRGIISSNTNLKPQDNPSFNYLEAIELFIILTVAILIVSVIIRKIYQK